VANAGKDRRRVRTLYLLRHAKSSWDDPGLADRDRPLTSRGALAARRMAEYVSGHGIRPALVLCSSARRATDTLAPLTQLLGAGTQVCVEDGLYDADARELLERLREVPASTPSVMVIGHNPTLQEVGMELAGDGEERSLLQLRTKFPTCALAVLDLEGTGWRHIRAGQAYLSNLVLPRRLS
jgi:phosphohistidine phosphatase